MNKEKKQASITFAIEESCKQELQKLAEEKYMSISNYIRLIVKEKIKSKQK